MDYGLGVGLEKLFAVYWASAAVDQRSYVAEVPGRHETQVGVHRHHVLADGKPFVDWWQLGCG